MTYSREPCTQLLPLQAITLGLGAWYGSAYCPRGIHTWCNAPRVFRLVITPSNEGAKFTITLFSIRRALLCLGLQPFTYDLSGQV
ncbi:hypothetical protein DP43_2248 [Burkholderia pseudomallei]|nr:hypothetical protein DP43_2248 [Burkholderia pseudomallei]